MISIPSFAKINLGLKIGHKRPDGFHELRTIYQTLALHDVVRVGVEPGSGIEIRCDDPRVPLDESNTCYKVAERVLAAADSGRIAPIGLPQGLKPASNRNLPGTAEAVPLQSQSEAVSLQSQSEAGPPRSQFEAEPLRNAAEKSARVGAAVERRFSAASQPSPPLLSEPASAGETPTLADIGKVVITIEKRLPVQGGMGAASSNAVATMLGLERALGAKLSPADRLRIAAEVGSDLPLFLIGGTVLGVGRGEEVYPLQDLPTLHLVVITPPVGVSTPRAFTQWDDRILREPALTGAEPAGTINKFSESVSSWLSASFYLQAEVLRTPAVGVDEAKVGPASGVPAFGGDRAETLLLDLVRAGIDNDFEHVVFPEYPELSEVKHVLEREGARYVSLSGSGSTLYGLFADAEDARSAAGRLRAAGHAAVATTTLTREEYWKAMSVG